MRLDDRRCARTRIADGAADRCDLAGIMLLSRRRAFVMAAWALRTLLMSASATLPSEVRLHAHRGFSRERTRAPFDAQRNSSRPGWGTNLPASRDGTFVLTPLAGVVAEVVGPSGLQAGPLGGGTPIGTCILLAFKPLWPAGR
jgi:hypothetical protein